MSKRFRDGSVRRTGSATKNIKSLSQLDDDVEVIQIILLTLLSPAKGVNGAFVLFNQLDVDSQSDNH